jgi:hypothetical protein
VGLSRRLCGLCGRNCGLRLCLSSGTGLFTREIVCWIIVLVLFMDFLGTRSTPAFFKAVVAKSLAANRTHCQTRGAVIVSTACALAKALGAIELLAVRAGNGTRRAERIAAVLAAVAILFVYDVAATVAEGAIPAVEFHVSAAPAVGVEHLGHEREEVIEPAIGQGAGNRRPSVAFTEAFILDMRMRDLFIEGGRVRIERHHAIGLLGGADLAPVQPDIKASEIDVFQNDCVGRNCKLMVLKIDLKLIEFLCEGQDVPIDLGWAGHRTRLAMRLDLADRALQFILKAAEGVGQVTEEGFFGQMPAALVCPDGLPL